jgi:hypothetical protein
VYSKYLANLFLKQIKVLNPGVNVNRPALAMVALDKGFNPSKGSILYKRRDKSYTFFLRDAVSLEHKKEVELHKLVF